jgi:DNA-binding transcriptional ArsR family regulator
MSSSDTLSRVFAALSDPTRREILVRIGSGSATVTELAEPFPISLPAVSRHLKVLEKAGLISRDRKAQWRTSELRAETLKEATTWIQHLNTLWDSRFDRLDAHLAAMKRKQNKLGGSPGSDEKQRPTTKGDHDE